MRRARAVVDRCRPAWPVRSPAFRRSPVATTPPTEPATTVASEEQAAAEAALLVLSDFPTGWTEEAEEEPTDAGARLPGDDRRVCRRHRDNLLDLGGPRAQTPDFVGPDEQRVEQSVTIVDPAVAEDFMARFAAPGVDRVLQRRCARRSSPRTSRARTIRRRRSPAT